MYATVACFSVYGCVCVCIHVYYRYNIYIVEIVPYAALPGESVAT